MTPDTVQVVIYDAPAAQASDCACGCSGHHKHNEPGDPLAGVSLELQTKALANSTRRFMPAERLDTVESASSDMRERIVSTCWFIDQPPVVSKA